MRAVIFITAGLGDAVLLIPLIKALRQAGRKVTGLFQSRFVSQAVFADSGLLDESIVLEESSSALLSFTARHYRFFDEAYLNHLAATPRNLVVGRLISKRVATTLEGRRQWLLAGGLSNVRTPVAEMHDALQNLRLFDSEAVALDRHAMAYSSEVLRKRFKTPLPQSILDKLIGPYIALQVCAANNLFQYKTWPEEHWISWLKLASQTYPGVTWVLLGEPSERHVADRIVAQDIPHVVSLVGETSLSQVMQVIWGSQLLVGLDSGLMHLAVAFGRPTFTLWGGSDPTLYGYEWLDPIRHRSASAKLPCGPCNSWVKPNTSRVDNPLKCPDFACMQRLNPEEVFQQFQTYFTALA